MSLHRLTRIEMGVLDGEAAAGFYRTFGLREAAPGRFVTSDGGEQLTLVQADRRGIRVLGIGVDDADDLARISSSLAAIGVAADRRADAVHTRDPGTGVAVRVEVATRLESAPSPELAQNAPGRLERVDARSPAVLRDGNVRPRKLSHVVFGSPDVEASEAFFQRGLGFAVSDRVPGVGAFMRCSTDHHNVLVQAAPVSFTHHTSWLVDDADEVGRGGAAMVEADPACHVWGLGRHYIGSNWFWYLRDPSGTFAEYSADLDVIVDDELWRPGEYTDRRALLAWAPPVPTEFIAPPDLDTLAHQEVDS
jgi:catechol 2,3-dioxygenase-like lactoylglutathione lyase family enzyme